MFICPKVFQNLVSDRLIGSTLSFYNTLQEPWSTTQITMKKNLISAALCTIIMCATTSCASIFCGSKARVTFDSNIKENVTLTIDGIKHNDVAFPYTTKVKRGFENTIVKAEVNDYNTDGRFIDYKTETIVIHKTFNPVSIINLGNLLSWGIDAATGAITKPSQNYIEIEFKPESKE